ncbi:helix-turn-helix domain-containing protein [Fictibacillus halophilus]|uniref:helix-turn-helix domain-containing protein n=1 Tax=Fictibacillus halophilus TaxID=1610490 RepID=UPI001CFB64EC|nr:helix-turn-helix transcriptional regulator [Fictibacillus halophilus]
MGILYIIRIRGCINLNLNEQIRYYRNSLNLSQTALASGICSVSYLSKIENGLTKPSDEIYSLLFYRLGLDPLTNQIITMKTLSYG